MTNVKPMSIEDALKAAARQVDQASAPAAPAPVAPTRPAISPEQAARIAGAKAQLDQQIKQQRAGQINNTVDFGGASQSSSAQITQIPNSPTRQRIAELAADSQTRIDASEMVRSQVASDVQWIADRLPPVVAHNLKLKQGVDIQRDKKIDEMGGAKGVLARTTRGIGRLFGAKLQTPEQMNTRDLVGKAQQAAAVVTSDMKSRLELLIKERITLEGKVDWARNALEQTSIRVGDLGNVLLDQRDLVQALNDAIDAKAQNGEQGTEEFAELQKLLSIAEADFKSYGLEAQKSSDDESKLQEFLGVATKEIELLQAAEGNADRVHRGVLLQNQLLEMVAAGALAIEDLNKATDLATDVSAVLQGMTESIALTAAASLEGTQKHAEAVKALQTDSNARIEGGFDSALQLARNRTNAATADVMRRAMAARNGGVAPAPTATTQSPLDSFLSR